MPSARTVVSRSALAAAIPIALAAWVYRPLLDGWFWADDLTNMASIANDGALPFVFRPFGGHNLAVRNLVFVASYDLFGLEARLWFWTVYLTHLLNVWLVFRVLRALTASATLACFGATLWGASPILAGALEWYSVFGHVLAATALLIVLERLAAVARAGASLPARTACTWYALLLLATLCFGVGLGIALAFPVALFVMLPAAWRQRGVRVAYLLLPAVTIALYVGFARLYPLFWGPLPQAQAPISGHVRNVPRALVETWGLVGFAASELPRGFLGAGRRGYPDRFSPWALALVGVGLGITLWRGDAGTRRAVAGLVMLTVGAYFVIALGRIWLVRPGFMLATQMRYHYAATIPLAALLCLALGAVGSIGWLRRVPRVALLAGALGVGAWSHARSEFVVDQHRNARTAARGALGSIVVEVRRSPANATVYLENGRPSFLLLGPVMQPVDFPGRAALLLIGQPDDVVEGRTVRFVERNRSILTHYQRRPESRLGRLLVGPEAVTAPPR